MTTLLIVLGFMVAIAATVITMMIVLNRGRAPHGTTGGDAPAERLTRDERAAQKAERAEDKRLPYRHLESDGAFFVHGNSVWTGLVLPSVTDELLADEDLAISANYQTRLLTSIARQFDRRVEFQLRVVTREGDPDEWADGVIAHAPKPTRWYIGAIRRIAARLFGIGGGDPVRVLLVRLGAVRKDGKVTPASSAAEGITGVHEETLTRDEIEHWRERAADVHAIAAGTVQDVTPIDRDTIVWLIRKPLHGHLPVPAAPDLGSRSWGKGDFTLIAGMAGSNHRNHLRLVQPTPDGEEAASYTAAMVVSEQPVQTTFRKSAAWVRHALTFVHGADLSWRFSILPPRQMKDAVDKIAQNLHDEHKDMNRAGVPADGNFADQLARADEVVAEASTGDLYGMQGAAEFILSAPTRRGLDQMVRDFKTHMGNIDVEVRRPDRMQYRLIESAMPGDGPRSAVAPWNRLTDPDMFGIGMATAGTEIGDRVQVDRDGRSLLGWRGRMIGETVRDGTPVPNDLHSAIARNKAGGVASIGGSGGGKSFLGLSSFQFESEAGRRCLAIDPKEDYAAMVYYFAFGDQVTQPGFTEEAARGTLGTPGSRFQPVWTEYWQETEVIDLARAVSGILDPFTVAASVAEGELLAQTFLSTVLSEVEWAEMRRPLNRSLAAVTAAYYDQVNAYARTHSVATYTAEEHVQRPSMLDFVTHLEKQAAARREAGASHEDIERYDECVDRMKTLARQPFARLAFGDGGQGVGALRKRRTVITMRGFPVPEETDPSKWKPNVKSAAGALTLALELANQMFTNDGDEQKVIFLDEAHIITGFADGRGIVRKGIKMGRSTYTVTYLITQQAADLKKLEDEDAEEGGANQFHEIFVFRQRSRAESRAALGLLGLDQNDERNLMALDLPTGVCVMRDADNRVATIQIDQMWSELRNATETNPSRRRDRQSQPFTADIYEWTWADDASADLPEQVEEYTVQDTERVPEPVGR